MTLSLLLLLTVSLMAGLYVERSVTHTEESRRVFSDRLIRNGFMSMTDIQRLLFVTFEARQGEGFTAEVRRDIATAADFLFVRADHFRQSLGPSHAIASAQTAIDSVETVLALADAAAAGIDDLEAYWADLSQASDNARRALTIFLEEAGRLQNEVLQDQANAMNEQRRVVLASLVGLTLIGIAALILLQKEVLTRRAREQAEDHIEFLAYFDQLTKLPNRVQFQAHLAKLLERRKPVTLVLIDVDHFKVINDTYGHATGDTLLCEVADLLSAMAKDTRGMAARLGGDEFAVLVPHDDVGRLPQCLDHLMDRMRAGFVVNGENIRVGLSVGYAASTGLGAEAAAEVDTLFRVADFALYSSKSAGRGRYAKYDRVLERRYQERRAMVDELTLAVESENLEIFLQPKVFLPGGEVYGFEALVRWRRGGRIVSSQEFINVAEESGLIYEIDMQVLRGAIRLLGEFNKHHGVSYSVSVNLSALHFSSARVVDLVREAMENSMLAEGLLVLEITETVELRDWWGAQQIIAQLRDLGARISVDDFGTGYSSLAYLRSKVVDEVKIDRSIVEQIETSVEAQFLLDGILDIAKNLGLDVVVEGVERVEQQTMLFKMGATRAQGFLFGPPIPAEISLRKALESSQRGPLRSTA